LTPKEELELTTFVEKVFRKELGQDKRGPAVEEKIAGVMERLKGSNRPRLFRTPEFRKKSNLWRNSFAVIKVLCTSTKIRTKLEGR